MTPAAAAPAPQRGAAPSPPTGPAATAARRRSATAAVVRSTWRGSHAGFGMLGVVLALYAVALLAMVAAAATTGRAPPFHLAAGAPWFGAMLGGASAALMASMWVLMRRRHAAARLAPGAERHLRQAMACCLLPLWGLLALPAAALVLAHLGVFAGGAAGAPADTAAPGTAAAAALLLFALGLPAAGIAIGLGLIALVSNRWWRAPLGLVPLLASQVDSAMLQTLPARDAWLALLGAAGLAAALWTTRRVATVLSSAELPATASATPAGALPAWQLDGPRSTPARQWHALLLPTVNVARRDRLLAVAGLALWAGWLHYTRQPWGVVTGLVITLPGLAGAPWVMGAWASPRLALLPGGLQRPGSAWAVWWALMRRALPPVAAAGVLMLAVSAAVLRLPADEVAATAALSLALALVAGSGAVAGLPWCR